MTIDVDARRRELQELRDRLQTAAHDLRADDEGGAEMTSATGDQHLADHAADMLDRELDDTIGENAEHVLREIDEALERIEAGTYGLCSACGKAIPEERLDAVPYATLCIEDKRRQELG